jgi:ABC-type Zn2+ transport system substrate-binding protein/surface adhesin
MGIALYGRDNKALFEFLDDRNRNQINGFFKRNWDSIKRESKQYRVSSEKDITALFNAMKRFQEDDEEDDVEDQEEDEDGDDNDDIEEDDGEYTKKTRMGTTTMT